MPLECDPRARTSGENSHLYLKRRYFLHDSPFLPLLCISRLYVFVVARVAQVPYIPTYFPVYLKRKITMLSQEQISQKRPSHSSSIERTRNSCGSTRPARKFSIILGNKRGETPRHRLFANLRLVRQRRGRLRGWERGRRGGGRGGGREDDVYRYIYIAMYERHLEKRGARPFRTAILRKHCIYAKVGHLSRYYASAIIFLFPAKCKARIVVLAFWNRKRARKNTSACVTLSSMFHYYTLIYAAALYLLWTRYKRKWISSETRSSRLENCPICFPLFFSSSFQTREQFVNPEMQESQLL